jgi:hypothetical protein
MLLHHQNVFEQEICDNLLASQGWLYEQPDAWEVLHKNHGSKAPILLAASKQQPAMTRTLYIRHVPDDVAERLEMLASRAGVPLSTFALQELSETARRADNAELLSGLPTAAIDPALILEALRQSRSERCWQLLIP